MYTYEDSKNELKKHLPIYQYLQNHSVPQKYLDQDRFALIFMSEETPAEPFIREGGILRKIAGNEFDPALFEGRNYQKYNTYRTDVYESPNYSGGGFELLTDAAIARMRQTFVAP